jgi:hypothetical protein
VILVVIDTVRADHTSLCGYARPTTPHLESWRARGAAVSCEAVAPGSWTLPSHASYFTGLEVPEHGAHFSADAADAIRGMHLTPLPPEALTLAEQLSAGGYQAIGVSANPVLAPASGLSQGFDLWTAAPYFGPLYGGGLVDALWEALDRADPARPLLLFLNVADAHDPWLPIPAGLPWLPAREAPLMYFEHDQPGEWEAYVTGALDPAAEAALRERVTDLYDYGVHRADDTLRAALALVEARGWLAPGVRLAIVSDHGEFLGEHQLLRHGRYLWEPNNTVPLLLWASPGAGALPTLPPRPSARLVHDWLLDGELDAAPPARAAAYPDRLWQERSGGLVGGSTSAAWWEGATKWVWQDGTVSRYDLDVDPGELRPRPADIVPDGFSAWVEAVRASGRRRVEATDPELIEALRAAGYVE